MTCRARTRQQGWGLLAVCLAGSAMLVVSAHAADLDIKQRAIRFNPSAASVKSGDTIRFHNEDDVTHNLMVTGWDGEPQDQGLQKPGTVTSVKFTEQGTFEVRCAIHPWMKMTVTVSK